jgi:tetratricopeptide (TPR) repeat protein
MNLKAIRGVGYWALAFLAAAPLLCRAQNRYDVEAIRVNNRGVALMGQQSTERAAESFADAFKKDPKLAQAAINEGIALLALQKLDEAKKTLKQGIAIDPTSAQAWYNLGLAQHAGNDLADALASFQQAVKLDPVDADSWYYEGACYQDMKQFDKAATAFEKALTINPLHVSAEFALARSLQRMGHAAEAREHFARFQHLTNAKVSSPLGLSYGEQGHYSTATAVEEPESIQQAMIPVRLVAQPIAAPGRGGASSWKTTGGACMMDVTGTGQMDLVLMQAGAQAIRVLHNRGGGDFAEVDAAAAGLKASGRGVACAVGDYDGDGLNDLAVALDDRVLLFHNLGHGQFKDVTSESGLAPRNRPTGITFVDYDHDGDLDLLLTGAPAAPGSASNVLWRNNGNGTFTEQTEQTGLGGSGKTAAAILTDFNNDRAVDLAVTGDGPSPLIYVNPREGKYPTQPLYEGAKLPPTVGITVLDYNKDGWMDIAVTHAGAPGLTLWRNVEAPDRIGRRFERVALPLHGAVRGWGLTPVDIDNDGWVDLAAIVETKAGPSVRVFRNKGDGGFEDVSTALGLDDIRLTAPRGLIAAEVYGDGAPDLIVTQENAPPVLLRNVGANKNHFVRLDLRGLADNKTGLGVKVEVFANGLWQKWELAGASGYQTQAAPQILVGLGDAPGIDVLRMLWPTGVMQDEIDLPQQQVIAMKEVDRRGSSCPVLFVWDGHRYKFVTDVIGAAVVGHWFTPTRRNTPNPGEWVKIDGANVALVNGKISARFMEPMEEVNYIDQLRMVAVDHPENVEVNPDERFLDDPPFASGRVVASTDTSLPQGAWDGEGRSRICERIQGAALRRICESARAHARSGRDQGKRSAAAADDRLRELLQRDLALCGVASGVEGDSAVRGGGAARRYMAADRRRCGISCRTGTDDRGGPDGQAARGHAAHSADDEPADLLGPGADRPEQRRGGADNGSSTGPRDAALPGLPEADRGRQSRRPELRLQSGESDRAVPARARQLHAHGRHNSTRQKHRRPVCSLRQRRGDCGGVRCGRSTRSARALEARLLFLCQRIRERHGLVGCVAIHRGATAVSWHERVSLSGERETG